MHDVHHICYISLKLQCKYNLSNGQVSLEIKKSILNMYLQPLPRKSPQYLLRVVQSREVMSAAAQKQFQAHNHDIKPLFNFVKDKMLNSSQTEERKSSIQRLGFMNTFHKKQKHLRIIAIFTRSETRRKVRITVFRV